MDDEEILACVEAAAGRPLRAPRLTVLGGRQGLLTCRVADGGQAWVFKAVRESGRRELALTARLAQLAPGLVPEVLASESDLRRGLHWIVMGDVGTRRLADSPCVEGFVRTGAALARVQAATLAETEALRSLGLRVVGASDWEEIALTVLAAAEGAGGGPGVEPGALEPIVWSATELAQAAAEAPTAVVHGDLHPGNVALRESGEPCLLDWGSAYLAAAFAGLEELLLPAARSLRGDGVARTAAAYLREWAPYVGRPSRAERPCLAARVLVRLQLLGQLLRGRGPGDEFAAAGAFLALQEAWQAWERRH